MKASNKTIWNPGAVYAYKLNSPLAEEKGLSGRYLLLQKIGEEQWSPRVIAPIVYTKLTKDSTLPSTVEEYNQLEYIQTWSTKYEDRFLPYDFSRLEEDIKEKSKCTFEVDEYGYLPHFRARLLLRAGVSVPSELIYVGNFPDAKTPPIEFIPFSTWNICLVYWKKDAGSFERKMIKSYVEFNLRTLQIYQKEKLTNSTGENPSKKAEDAILFGKQLNS